MVHRIELPSKARLVTKEDLYLLAKRIKPDEPGLYLALLSRQFDSSTVLEVPFGILRADEIEYGYKAKVHAYFWSHEFLRQVEIIRECIEWVMSMYRLERLVCEVPGRFNTLCKLLEKLGFELEGVHPKGTKFRGVIYDSVTYGIVR